jgi:hypothetical protein
MGPEGSLMRKSRVILGAAVLLAIGFGAGWLAASRPGGGSIRGPLVTDLEPIAGLGHSKVRELAMPRVPGPPSGLGSLKAWHYPGSTPGASGSAVGSRTTGQVLHTAFTLGNYQLLTTSDDFDKVVAFYQNKATRVLEEAGFAKVGPVSAKDKADPTTHLGGGVMGGTENNRCGGSIFQFDCHQPGPGIVPRKVLTALVGVRFNNYYVNAFVSRAEGEPLTHVILTFDQWYIEPKVGL